MTLSPENSLAGPLRTSSLYVCEVASFNVSPILTKKFDTPFLLP